MPIVSSRRWMVAQRHTFFSRIRGHFEWKKTVKRLRPRMRYVAICDILGLRELLHKKDVFELAQDYARLFDTASSFNISHALNARQRYECTLTRFVFSDSFFVWSEPIDSMKLSEYQGQHYFSLLGMLWALALKYGFPMRVGVAYGSVVIDADSGIFLGIPIVNAHITEQAQDWVGMACHPTCLEAPHADLSQHKWVRYPIPMKPNVTCPRLDWAIEAPTGFETKALLQSNYERYKATQYEPRWKRALDFHNHCLSPHRKEA